jgi:hypothetical protein
MHASHSWLLLTIPLGLAAIALLVRTIASLIRTVRGSVVASLPIRTDQSITFESAGEFAINLESPLGSLRPTSLHFALRRADDAMQIPLRAIVFRTEATSFSRSRIELYAMTIPAPGGYALRIDGIDPTASYSGQAIVVARRFGAALVLHILALVFLGAIVVGSLVVTGLVLSGKI